MKRRVKIVLMICIVLLFCINIDTKAQGASLNLTKITINIGDTVDLDVTNTDKTAVWTSYNENIAKVDQNGEVTALRKGKTTIKARIGFEAVRCTVTVVDPGIKLNRTVATIYSGGTSTNTVQLKATVTGATKEVTWTSSNETVACVDQQGKVTSVSAGTAIISATANGKSVSCTVTVKESSISLNMENMQLGTKGTGSSMKLTTTIVGSKKSVKWSSSDKTIATVSGGKVTGKKDGVVTITATANGVSATCNVTVVDGLISINEEKVLLYVGGTKTETKQLKTNARKSDTVTWTTTDPAIATVTEKGLVTATGKGTAFIKVECNGKTDSCEITVKDTATTIREESVSLRTKGVEKTYLLDSTVVGRSSSVVWKSDNKSVATVSKGKITAKKAGTATITATANGVSDSVSVVVENYIPTIKLNQSEYVLYTIKGNTMTLKATVDGPSKTVTWTSSNEAVATVTNKGKVTAKGEGNTIISASANGVVSECIITVKESEIFVEKENLHLNKGEAGTIPVDVTGVSQTVKWTTTNSKVATVKNGVVTAKNYGEADIKITANGVTKVCHVNVAECKHNFDRGVITEEANCAKEGVKTYTCILCQYSYTESIPKTDHSWSEWSVIKEPTETELGEKKHTCVICGVEETEILPVKEHVHQYEKVVIQPTCTEDGYTTYTCSCGDTYNAEPVPAGHRWGEWTVIKEPTATETGEKKRTCTICELEEKETLPATEHVHKYEKVVIEPTCITIGYTSYTCSCGDYYTSDNTPLVDHSWGEWIKLLEPTENEVGIKKRVCSVCNKEDMGKIPPLSHKHDYAYAVEKTEPTCTKYGYTTHFCSCGESFDDESVEPLGHDFEEKVTKEPSCTEKGEKTCTCTRCGIESIDTIAPQHTWDEGVIDYEQPCGSYSQIPMGGTKIANCDRITFTCTQCSETMVEFVETKGHDWVETVQKKATCSEKGYKEEVCSHCKRTQNRADIDFLPHTIVPDICTVTEANEGRLLYQFACTTCKNSVYDFYVCSQGGVDTILYPNSKENTPFAYVTNTNEIYLRPDFSLRFFNYSSGENIPTVQFKLKNSTADTEGIAYSDGYCELRNETAEMTEESVSITGKTHGESELEVYGDNGQRLLTFQIILTIK